MGKPKGSKLEKNDKGKQIQEDSSRNEKDSECYKRKPINKDKKYRAGKKECDEFFMMFFEWKSGKKLPRGKKLAWGKIKKGIKVYLEEKRAEMQLQEQTLSVQQQDLEKAEHMKQSTKRKCAKAAMMVEKEKSLVVLLQEIILCEDKTDQEIPIQMELLMPGTSSGAGTSTAMTSTVEGINDLLSLPMASADFDYLEFVNLIEDELMPGTSSGAGTSTAMTSGFFDDLKLENWMKRYIKPGTISAAGTSTAMTSTGEGDYQNNGVNETFGVE